jgi:hypothetical protein
LRFGFERLRWNVLVRFVYVAQELCWQRHRERLRLHQHAASDGLRREGLRVGAERLWRDVRVRLVHVRERSHLRE